MARHVSFTLLAAAVLPVLALVGTATEVSAAPSMTSTAQDTLVGTVRSVNYETNTVELLTGLGFAIRIERVKVEPATSVMIGGEARPLDNLRRGQVVLVEYREAAGGKVAISLKVVRMESGGAP
jgi:hypothetical protein